MSRQPTGYYLIAYDIRCPRRLRRVHKALRREGLAVQYSVFLCPAPAFGELWQELKAEIRSEDDLRAYPVTHLRELWLSGRSWQSAQEPERRTGGFLRLFGVRK